MLRISGSALLVTRMRQPRPALCYSPSNLNTLAAARPTPPAHPQVAYCAPYMGGMSQANCGKCLRMTNGRTGSHVIVRIVDMCGHGGKRGEPLPARH